MEKDHPHTSKSSENARSSTIYSQEFKSMQRQGWDSVSAGWKRWWPTIEESAQVVSDRLTELARVREGKSMLDVATGIGEPAVTAARKVGSKGKVTAIDLSPGMLAIARQRAQENGLAGIIEFQEGDAETFRLPSSKYDAIVSRFGLMFLPDLTRALKTMREALVQDGRIAAAVWSSPQKVPFLSTSLEIVMKETGTKPPPPDAPGPFSLADTKLLQERFKQAGFQDIGIENGIMNFNLPSPEGYVDFARSTAEPLNAMMAGLDSARKEEIWTKVLDASKKFADTDGRANFINEVIYVSAGK